MKELFEFGGWKYENQIYPMLIAFLSSNIFYRILVF